MAMVRGNSPVGKPMHPELMPEIDQFLFMDPNGSSAGSRNHDCGCVQPDAGRELRPALPCFEISPAFQEMHEIAPNFVKWKGRRFRSEPCLDAVSLKALRTTDMVPAYMYTRGDRQVTEIALHQWLDLFIEIEFPVSASEHRKCIGCRTDPGAVCAEFLQPSLNVLGSGRISPVFLGGKVEDPLVWCPVEKEHANLQAPVFTMFPELPEHLGVDLLEPESNALSHHSTGVHGIDQYL